MRSMEASGWTKILWLGLCGTVVLLGTFQLYEEFKVLTPGLASEKSAAALQRSNGVVRHRSAATLTWQPISAGFPLQVGDAILTAKDAQAEIVWHNGEKMKVAGGVMFLIPADPKGLTVPPPLLDMPDPRPRDVAGQRDRN